MRRGRETTAVAALPRDLAHNPTSLIYIVTVLSDGIASALSVLYPRQPTLDAFGEAEVLLLVQRAVESRRV